MAVAECKRDLRCTDRWLRVVEECSIALGGATSFLGPGQLVAYSKALGAVAAMLPVQLDERSELHIRR